jgi:hypothetical protein
VDQPPAAGRDRLPHGGEPRSVPKRGRRRMTTSASVATMAAMSYHPWQFLLVALAGWINRHQQDVIAYLQEENRVYREQATRPRSVSGSGWRPAPVRRIPVPPPPLRLTVLCLRCAYGCSAPGVSCPLLAAPGIWPVRRRALIMSSRGGSWRLLAAPVLFQNPADVG